MSPMMGHEHKTVSIGYAFRMIIDGENNQNDMVKS
jgi:hypothetical protein